MRERAEPRGLGVRKESARAQSFCFKSKGTSVPSGTPRSVRELAKTEINFVGPPTLPFSCSAKPHYKFRCPRRSGLAELIVLCKGTFLAVVYDDVETGEVPERFTWTWDWLLGISFQLVLHRFLSRLFLCTPSFKRCGGSPRVNTSVPVSTFRCGSHVASVRCTAGYSQFSDSSLSLW